MNTIPPEIKIELTDAVMRKVSEMSEVNQEAFVEEFKKKRKSPTLAWWLCWGAGLHYAYIGKWWLTLIFWFTLGGFWIWWVRDLFTTKKMVREYNKSVAISVLKDIQVLA